jgi:hypothetical protein
MGSCHVSLIYAIMRKNRFNMATCVTKNYRSNALRDHMHLDIILTQLYVRCIPILSTLALSYPIIRTSLYTDPMHFDIILTLIIRTLYTDPMHFDIILTQLYVRRCIPILCTLTLYLRSLYVRCIPILCTSTLYLPNYTYVVVYRSYALWHYTYVHYMYVVYRSYALRHYTYSIIRTSLYTDPMHFDIILTQLYVRRCIPILYTLTLYLRSLYVRCIPILCTSTLYLPNYTYVVVYQSYALWHYTYVHYTYIVYRSYALRHYTYSIIRTSLYTDHIHLDIIWNRTLFHNLLGTWLMWDRTRGNLVYLNNYCLILCFVSFKIQAMEFM